MSDSTHVIQSPDTAKKDLSQLGFELFTSETVGSLKVGMKKEDVLKLLGEPQNKTEIGMWEADGDLHQEWQYEGLALDMSNSDSNNLDINCIHVKSPSKLRTSRNIGIGSTYSETKTAYEKYFNTEESNDSVLVAGTIYGGVIINFEKGKVSRLFVGPVAE